MADIVDIRFNPFTEAWNVQQKNDEAQTVPASSPYWFGLEEVPQKNDPSDVSVMYDSDAWAASTAYSLNDLIKPTSSNQHGYKCTTAGTSGASEPSPWGTVAAGTTADGTVVWTEWNLIEKTSAPAAHEFQVDYPGEQDGAGAYGSGLVLFNSADASKDVFVTYKGTGTCVDKDHSVADAGVTQAKLKTSLGSVNTTWRWLANSGSYLGANLTLPGGEYGFVQQLKTASSGYHVYATTCYAFYDNGGPGIKGILSAVSYVSNIRLGTNSSSSAAYAQQRYVTSSGEVFWIFLLKNKSTGLFECGYQAPDHPCFGNTGDPTLVPHPFSDFNPVTHEIIVINPSKEKVKEMKVITKAKRLGQPRKDILELFSPIYEELSEEDIQAGKEPKIIKDALYKPNMYVEMEYPNIAITTGIIEDEDERPLWFMKEAKVIKLNIKKYQPDYIKVRGIK